MVEHESWECPDCGNDSYNFTDGYYYFNGKKLVDCTIYDKKKAKIYANPPKGKQAYPRYENYEYSRYASMEFGVNGHSWDEVHFCPNCKKEFIYCNSDY